MERKRFNDGGSSSPFASPNGGASTRPPRQPNYTCNKVQEALEHLASIDPIELCNEAKVEHCRATRDLRNCGRFVQSVLNSCGHASLCEECSQRCDVCPICRIPLPKDGNRFRLRLYYECIEACLISKRCDDRLQDKEDGGKELIADVQRLYSLFDVALENSLSSLICHYVTDVCMDESAVSSDPVIAFLLDEVVVKDWCKQTFKHILAGLQVIYNLTREEIKESVNSLLKFSVKLAGLANVLEVLESSFKGSLSAKLHDLYHLQESILKTKQHMEIVSWSMRHEFLEDVRSRHPDIASWRCLARERKSAAIGRAWPEMINCVTESRMTDSSTLFIEDALSNLDIEQGHIDDHGEELQIATLHKDGGSLFLRSKLEGLAGLYPFENVRVAIDALFLQGSSDLVVSKQAIFLYYLFDRHWTMPEDKWRYIVDDFAATLSITRHSLLESFVFYLLDDHTEEALQEACRLLPEISSPTIHPKVAQVLLERQSPDAALMVLRWSGRDEARVVSLEEAVTTVRVHVECGLLTEAFMYQRAVCIKVKEKKLKDESFQNTSVEVRNWAVWVESMVTEICCLCIRRNLVDRMIELPWNSDEEKHIHNCLLNFATVNPSSTMGSLLVVFFLQRFRYIEAYEADRKLQSLEQDFISENLVSEQVLIRMRSISHWRAGLVVKSVELLPDVLQQQLKNGKLPQVVAFSSNEVSSPVTSDLSKAQEPVFTSLLVPPVTSSLHGMDNGITSLKHSVLDTSRKVGGSLKVFNSSYGNYGASVSPAKFFNGSEIGGAESGLRRKFNFDDIPTANRFGGPSLPSPIRHLNSTSSRAENINRQNGPINKFQNTRSTSHRAAANPVTPLRSNQEMFTDFAQDMSMPIDLPFSNPADIPLMPESDHLIDMSWSHEKRRLSVGEKDTNIGPRWRSDDASDGEEYQSPDRLAGVANQRRNVKAVRRGRLLTR